MNFKLLAAASTAAIAFAGTASALDVKITGNIEVKLKKADVVSVGANDYGIANAAGGTVGAAAALANAAAASNDVVKYSTLANTNDVHKGSYLKAVPATAAVSDAVPTAATHMLADAATWYADDSVTDVDDWAATTEGDIDFSITGSNCCFEYGGFAGLKLTDSQTVTVDDLNIFIKSAQFGRLEFGIDSDGKQGAFDRDVLSAGPASVGLTVWNAHEAAASVTTNDTFTATDYTSTTAQMAGDNALQLKDMFTGTAVSGTGVEWSHSLGGFTVAAAANLGGADTEWEASAGYTMNLLGADTTIIGAITSNDAYALRAKTKLSNVDLIAGYAADDDDESSLYFGAATSMAGFALSAEIAMNESETNVAERIATSLAVGTASGTLGVGVPADAAADTVMQVSKSEDTQIAVNAAYTLAPGLVASAGMVMYDVETTDVFSGLASGDGTATDGTMSFANAIDGSSMHARLKLTF